MSARRLRLDRLPTPVGTLEIVQDDAARLCALDWEDYHPRMLRLLARYHRAGAADLIPGDGRGPVLEALRAYLAGAHGAIDDLAIAPGGTAFQQRVWQELRRVPCGRTITYGELADRVGKPRAARAVGLANGANPVCIVVPCHRVLGADRSLTGYGGGLARKRWLLAHEGVAAPPGA
jgi:methylated-DNA-[protein]-cysteine S-methyltransferase